ncbi:MAG TPA: rhodanese-like domain-containing protein [Thermoanaerobaculia bacterium]
MPMKTGGWLFLLVFAVSLPAAGQGSPLQWPVPPPRPPRETVFPRVLIAAPELARALVAGGVPIDARGAGEFAAGHLPGAVPAGSEVSADVGRLRARLAGLGISGRERVVVYGDSDREAIALLYWLLRRAGCAEVRILDGGLDAWRAAGGAIETGPARRAPAAAFHPVPQEEAAVDAGWVAGHFGAEGVELLDARDARGWERWETPPTFAAGHIPYGLPFDPRALLPAGGGWPEPAALRRRLAALGPRPGDPVRPESTFVVYGEDARDPRPALGLLLLTLAGFEARIFPGGWKEWTADGSRPVVRVVSAAEVAGRLRPENPRLAADRRPRDLMLLDLREPGDFAIGHLPGALNLPILRFAAELEAVVSTSWPAADRATAPLLLYCYGIDCVRSRKAGAQAARLGFRNVLWFRGGIQEWRDAGYPLLDSPPATSSPSTERASPAGAGARP